MDTPRRLVIVEDDATFARTLQRSFERRGYLVWVARSPDELAAVLPEAAPGHAVIDLKLGTASGLPCVRRLHAHDPAMVIVVLTGFASIAIKTLEWERINETLVDTDFNISETARRLGMHRRTLARKLEKRPIK